MSADPVLALPCCKGPKPATALLVTLLAALAGCAGLPTPQPAAGHLQKESVAAPKAGIPPPVLAAPVLAAPKAAPKAETYSVSVRNIPAQELLFAISRDARLNIDLHPGIAGNVTINAIDQTLQQILTRIAKQVDMRWEIDGPNLVILPDTPYLQMYSVDYVNMNRSLKGTVSIETEIPTTGGSQSSSSGSAANTTLESTAKNELMNSVVENVKSILKESDQFIPLGGIQDSSEARVSGRVSASGTGSAAGALPSTSGGSQTNTGNVVNQAGSGGGFSGRGEQSVANDASSNADRNRTNFAFERRASVIPNYETGVLAVRATKRQHEKIQEFLAGVMTAARREVLIEATVAEVSLNNNNQQGINWSRLASGINGGLAYSLAPITSGSASLGGSGTASFLRLTYSNPTSALGDISASVNLLESYGSVRVLSSPKLSVLNNQTALLKVVDNEVFFNVKATVTPGVNGGAPIIAYTSDQKTVAVGFVMTVTPQVAANGDITLNVRPTLSRIVGYKDDPNPDLRTAGVINQIPIIRTRELESLLRLRDGEIAVLGGLMQDESFDNRDGVPGTLGSTWLHKVLGQTNETRRKTELVLFLKPTIIRDPSLSGEYSRFAKDLPQSGFFANQPAMSGRLIGNGAN